MTSHITASLTAVAVALLALQVHAQTTAGTVDSHIEAAKAAAVSAVDLDFSYLLLRERPGSLLELIAGFTHQLTFRFRGWERCTDGGTECNA